jgi:hypothetical protein
MFRCLDITTKDKVRVFFIHQLMHKWIVLKTILKIYIKINIKTAPMCFGAVTLSSGSTLLVLAKVTVLKIANLNTSVCGDVAAYISGSVMNKSLSSTVIREYSKQNYSINNDWTYPCWCVYIALFGSRLSYVMRSWLCDMWASLYRGFMSMTFCSSISMLHWWKVCM